MKLTEELVRQYHEEGYTLVRGLIPAEVVSAVRQRALEVAAGKHNWGDGPFQVIDPQRYRRPDGGLIPIGLQGPSKQEEVFSRMALHANLQDAMRQILGGEVHLFTDQAIIKHGMLAGEQGGRSYYHQDSYYWHIDPALGANCWIPLDEADRDAIALGIMPGSHRGWKLLEHEAYYDDPPWCSARTLQPFKRLRIPASRIDFSREVVLPMMPGDGLFFTNYTWHRSEPNRTGRDKLFYAIAYQRKPGAASA
ncbi:MAG: phytanoyl-CoA dioxygenase family protein [Planctomycetes bacterium]|nr:phytanoyl-CoA dioxygenase family protein [Planctomycetota bacterium]